MNDQGSLFPPSDQDKSVLIWGSIKDAFELRVAESYVSKTDLQEAMERFETHMLRIENKLDRIILK